MLEDLGRSTPVLQSGARVFAAAAPGEVAPWLTTRHIMIR